MTQFYTLSKKHQLVPADLSTWAAWFEDINNRRLANITLEGVTVSTIFLGFDNGFNDEGLFFETMVFAEGEETLQRRWHTWDEAIEGHRRIVADLREELGLTESG